MGTEAEEQSTNNSPQSYRYHFEKVIEYFEEVFTAEDPDESKLAEVAIHMLKKERDWINE